MTTSRVLIGWMTLWELFTFTDWNHGSAAPIESVPFDTNIVMSVELRLSPEDWKTLRYQHREAEFFPEETSIPPTNAYTWFAAQAKITGRDWDLVQVRKKGYIGSNDTRRPGLKVRLTAPGKPDSHSVRELTLNNNAQDPSLIRQAMAYEIFRRAGVPAPRCAFARVTVNGRSLGLYTRVEPIDTAFLQEHFGRADGNLYEGGRSDFRPGWFENFEVKNVHGTNHHADLQTVTAALEGAPDAPLPVVERFFESEEFFRFWAVESLINEGDGYAGNMNNFFLYHHPGTGKFSFIPWGPDTSFYSGRGPNNIPGDAKSVIGVSILANRLYNSAAGADRYRSTLKQLLAEAWNEKLLLREVDRLEALLLPNLDSEAEGFRQNVESLRRFISARKAELEPELSGPAPLLKAKPLPLAKRRNIGRIEAHFRASWDSAPVHSGQTNDIRVTGRLWDDEMVTKATALQAQRRMRAPGGEAEPMILLTFETTKHPQCLVYLVIDPESYELGRILPIDNTHVYGAFIQSDASGRSSKMIGMLRGTLLLKTAASIGEGAIDGDVIADVFSKLPKP